MSKAMIIRRDRCAKNKRRGIKNKRRRKLKISTSDLNLITINQSGLGIKLQSHKIIGQILGSKNIPGLQNTQT